jgi:hypothetical protein
VLKDRSWKRILWKGLVRIIAAALITAASLGTGAELPASVKRDALKVQKELDRIEAENLRGKTGPVKSVMFTETELNAWVAYRLDEQKEDVLRELVLKLFADNRVEGKAFVDLSKSHLPLGLKPRMNLYFSGRVIVQAGAAKVEFEKLFIESQQVSMILLDLMIAISSGLGKSDAGSIKDWIILPYGLKDLRGEPGRVHLYY